MASSRVFVLCGLVFAMLLLVSSYEAAARELVEETNSSQSMKEYGLGKGHGSLWKGYSRSARVHHNDDDHDHDDDDDDDDNHDRDDDDDDDDDHDHDDDDNDDDHDDDDDDDDNDDNDDHNHGHGSHGGPGDHGK